MSSLELFVRRIPDNALESFTVDYMATVKDLIKEMQFDQKMKVRVSFQGQNIKDVNSSFADLGIGNESVIDVEAYTHTWVFTTRELYKAIDCPDPKYGNMRYWDVSAVYTIKKNDLCITIVALEPRHAECASLGVNCDNRNYMCSLLSNKQNLGRIALREHI